MTFVATDWIWKMNLLAGPYFQSLFSKQVSKEKKEKERTGLERRRKTSEQILGRIINSRATATTSTAAASGAVCRCQLPVRDEAATTRTQITA